MTFNPAGTRRAGIFLGLVLVLAQGIHGKEAPTNGDPMAGNSPVSAAAVPAPTEVAPASDGPTVPGPEALAGSGDSTASPPAPSSRDPARSNPMESLDDKKPIAVGNLLEFRVLEDLDEEPSSKDDASAALELVDLLLKENDMSGALEVLRALLGNLPGYHYGRLTLARLLAATGDRAGAAREAQLLLLATDLPEELRTSAEQLIQ